MTHVIRAGATIAAAAAAIAVAVGAATPAQAKAAREENVIIERMLAMSHCKPGRLDGVFDAQTSKALLCLQKRIGDRKTGELSPALRRDMLAVWRENIAGSRRTPTSVRISLWLGEKLRARPPEARRTHAASAPFDAEIIRRKLGVELKVAGGRMTIGRIHTNGPNLNTVSPNFQSGFKFDEIVVTYRRPEKCGRVDCLDLRCLGERLADADKGDTIGLVAKPRGHVWLGVGSIGPGGEWRRMSSAQIAKAASSRGADELMEAAGLGLDGARVTAVAPGGPGAKVGLRVGDVVTAVNGFSRDAAGFSELILRRVADNSSVLVFYRRGGAEHEAILNPHWTVDANGRRRPAPVGAPLRNPFEQHKRDRAWRDAFEGRAHPNDKHRAWLVMSFVAAASQYYSGAGGSITDDPTNYCIPKNAVTRDYKTVLQTVYRDQFGRETGRGAPRDGNKWKWRYRPEFDATIQAYFGKVPFGIFFAQEPKWLLTKYGCASPEWRHLEKQLIKLAPR